MYLYLEFASSFLEAIRNGIDLWFVFTSDLLGFNNCLNVIPVMVLEFFGPAKSIDFETKLRIRMEPTFMDSMVFVSFDEFYRFMDFDILLNILYVL